MGTSKTAKAKHEFLDYVFYKAKEENRQLDYNSLITEFCIRFNSTAKTAKEYISLYKNIGRIKIVDNLIIQNEKTNSDFD